MSAIDQRSVFESIRDRFSNLPLLKVVLLGLFLLTTGWIFVGSYSLSSSDSAIFPRLSGGILIVLFGLLFLKQFTPQILVDWLPHYEALTYGGGESEFQQYTLKNVYLTFFLFGCYVAAVYLVGFLIATPAYVLINLHIFNFGGWIRRGLILFAVILVTLFAYEVLRIPLDQGLLL